MSVSNAKERDTSAREPVRRAIALLEEALRIVDENAATPEIGARLQEVIEGLKAQLD